MPPNPSNVPGADPPDKVGATNEAPAAPRPEDASWSVGVALYSGWLIRLLIEVHVYLWWLVFVIGLRIMPLEKFIRALSRVRGGRPWSRKRMNYMIWRIDVMLGYSGEETHGRCLLRSSMQFRSLLCAGLKPELNIGLTLRDGVLGHAWVSLDKRIPFDSQNQWRHFGVLLHQRSPLCYWIETRNGENAGGAKS